MEVRPPYASADGDTTAAAALDTLEPPPANRKLAAHDGKSSEPGHVAYLMTGSDDELADPGSGKQGTGKRAQTSSQQVRAHDDDDDDEDDDNDDRKPGPGDEERTPSPLR